MLPDLSNIQITVTAAIDNMSIVKFGLMLLVIILFYFLIKRILA